MTLVTVTEFVRDGERCFRFRGGRFAEAKFFGTVAEHVIQAPDGFNITWEGDFAEYPVTEEHQREIMAMRDPMGITFRDGSRTERYAVTGAANALAHATAGRFGFLIHEPTTA